MIAFRLDRRSGVAAYLQLVHQVHQAIRMGALHSGDRLPTVKEVVGMTGVNPNTVFRAYQELEHQGITEARRGVGTFVRHTSLRVLADTELAAEASAWVAKAHAADLSREEVTALFTAARDQHYAQEEHKHEKA